MNWVFGTIAATLGIFFFWGLVAPRSQWRVLSSWSVSDPHTHEPGGAAYGWRRLLSGLAVLGLAVVAGIGAAPTFMAQLPKPPAFVHPVELMWGTPEPQLVERVVYPLDAPPEGLAPTPVLAYQDLDDEEDLPGYLLALEKFRYLGSEKIPGYIGSNPEPGFSAIGPANLVVHVRGPVLCIPRQAVVIETETTVQIGIYYGLPDPAPVEDADETDSVEDEGEPAPPVAPDHLAGCPEDAPVTGSVLIPILLASELGDREVQNLDGTPLYRVDVVSGA